MPAVLLKDLSDSGHWEENEGWFLEGGQVWSDLTLAKGKTGLLLFESEAKILFFQVQIVFDFNRMNSVK